MGGGSDPDVATLVGSGFLPDADVMPFGEGIERFLEDERPTRIRPLNATPRRAQELN